MSAVLSANNNNIENALRRFLPISSTYNDFRDYIDSHIKVLRNIAEPLELTREIIAETLQDKLVLALSLMYQGNNSDRINVIHLFCGLLEKDEERHHGIITAYFKNSKADAARILETIRRACSDKEENLPLSITEGLAGRDFTWEAEQGNFEGKSGFEETVNNILGVIYRKKCNSAIVLAHEGTGRTSFLEQLALTMCSKELSSLHSKKVVVLDCSKIHPEGRKTFLQRALEFIYTKRDVILALDGLESIFIGQESVCRNRDCLSGAVSARLAEKCLAIHYYSHALRISCHSGAGSSGGQIIRGVFLERTEPGKNRANPGGRCSGS